METKKILITGVAGLFGSHLSTYLLDKGYEVIGIDNLSGGYDDFVDERLKNSARFYATDLLDTATIEKIFSEHKPDFVYHFAAYAAEGLSPFIRNFNYKNNLICSVNIINACIKHNVKKIIFTSSMAVYGHGVPPFKEDQTPTPADPYGIAKYAVEMDIIQACEQFKLNYTIVRPHNVIGTRQNIWDKYRNVIGIWIRESLQNGTLLVFGDGEQTRAFSDIKYYMEPFEKLLYKADGEILNLGADKEFKLNMIAALVKKVANELGYNPDIKHAEQRNEVKDAYCDHAKAKDLLGFSDATDIEQTVREMFVWAKAQPAREVKRMDYEIEKNIYSFWK